MTTDDHIAQMNTKLDSIIDKDGDAKKTFLRWLFGQESSTIALWVIFIAIACVCQYAIVTGIPMHLKMIQGGYEKVISEAQDMVKDISAKDREEHITTRAQFEKTLDRFEKTFEAGFKAGNDATIKPTVKVP